MAREVTVKQNPKKPFGITPPFRFLQDSGRGTPISAIADHSHNKYWCQVSCRFVEESLSYNPVQNVYLYLQ